jgi:CheY-like chemotaxis protein
MSMIDEPRRVRVLHVEDDALFADLVRAMLEAVAPELEVEHAGGLSAALARLVQDRYEVIVTDLDLPDSEGAETVRHLQRAAHRAPLVVLSGTGDLEAVVESIHEGADDFAVKGDLDADGVAQLVRLALEHGRRQTRPRRPETAPSRPPGLAALRTVGGNLLKVVDRIGLHLVLVLVRVPGSGPDLQQLFGVLRGALRRADFVCRVSPDELAVVLVGRRPEPGAGMARLEAAIAASGTGPDARLGFAVYDREHPASVDGLITQARRAARPLGGTNGSPPGSK